jgi:hypothetical protein
MLLRLGKAAISPEYWATEDIERFKITYTQVSQLIIIENRYSEQIAPLMQQVNQAERELIDLMVTTASAPQILSIERQIEALKIQAAQLYFDEALEIRELLTLAQRLQLSTFRNVEKH